MRLIVVGGVPGAGKSTALAAYAGSPGTLVLDPDALRARVRWRPLVHALHQTLVWAATLLGPAALAAVLGEDGVVLVHDTATRRRRRELYLRLAVRRGWDVRVLLLDVSRSDAVAGQFARGRMVPADSFDRHWSRWVRWRETGVEGAVVVRRERAADALAELVEPTRLAA